MVPTVESTPSRVERLVTPVGRWARAVRRVLRVLLALFTVGDVVLLLAVSTLVDGTAQWVALAAVGTGLAVALGCLVLLVGSLTAVMELPDLLREVAARHAATGTQLAAHLKGREGRALRRLAVREAIPALRSAYDVKGAAAASVALVRLNPAFLLACGLSLLAQLVVLGIGLPLLAIGVAT